MHRVLLQMRQWVAPARALLATCAVVTLAAILLSAATAFLDGARIREAIAFAFDTGALVDQGYLGNDARRGRYTVNDCLILQTLALAEADWRNPAIRSRVLDAPDKPVCAALRQFVNGMTAAQTPGYDYSRYFFAAKAFIGPALLVLPVDAIRQVLRATVYGLLLLVLVVSLTRSVQMKVGNRLLPLTLLVLSCAWLTLYDLRYYAPLFSHAFSELVLAGYMAYVLFAPPAGPNGVPARVIWLGALTACFELLTGPALLAAGLAVLLDFAQEPARPKPVRRAIAIWCVTALAVLVTLLFLQVAVVATDGPGALRQFVWHLLLRMDLHLVLGLPMEANWKIAENLMTYSMADVGRAVFRNLPTLTHSSRRAANIVFVGSVLALAWTTAVGMRRPEKRAVLVYVCVALSLALWSFVFANHTVIHAWAMVRMAVLLPVCAVLSLLYLYGPTVRETPASARSQS